MKKKVTVNGELLRKEREKRAWTQEELSERSQLGVRTLRRLEAGHGSLETLRRVSQALELAPEVPLAVAGPPTSLRDQLRVDPVTLLLSSDLCGEDFPQKLAERVGSVRRHLAATLGTVVPGVRLRDHPSVPALSYEILIHEHPVARGQLQPVQWLAVGPAELLEQLEGEPAQDPTYGMPGRWLAESQRTRAEALGVMVFDPVSVLATHLTETLRRQAAELLGIEDVHYLLETLEQPHLVAEVLPGKLNLAEIHPRFGLKSFSPGQRP